MRAARSVPRPSRRSSRRRRNPAAAAYPGVRARRALRAPARDEARAVKSYGRALTLDPAAAPEPVAIRRVFYRRGLWPNLAKLIGAEVEYARDDYERADLLLEKARILGHRMNDVARGAGGARRGGPDLAERTRARCSSSNGSLRATTTPPRCSTYGAARAGGRASRAQESATGSRSAATSGTSEYARAQAAFDKAAELAAGGPFAERVARERLADRGGERHARGRRPRRGREPRDPAARRVRARGPEAAASADAEHQTDRATAIRRELVALRRRQAQLARTGAPERAWDVLQQALALSRPASPSCSRISRSSPRSSVATRTSPSSCRAGRRSRVIRPRDGAVDPPAPTRCCAAVSAIRRARCSRLSRRAPRLHRPDLGGGTRCARSRRRRRSRADLYRGRACRAAR